MSPGDQLVLIILIAALGVVVSVVIGTKFEAKYRTRPRQKTHVIEGGYIIELDASITGLKAQIKAARRKALYHRAMVCAYEKAVDQWSKQLERAESPGS